MTAGRLKKYFSTTSTAPTAATASRTNIPTFLLQNLIVDKQLCLLVVTYLEPQIQAQIDQVFRDPIIQTNANHAQRTMKKLTSSVRSAEQDKKEAEYKVVSLLKRNGQLAQAKCPIPLSIGTREMTPLQKAFYSLDWHLWREIIKSMKPEDIKQQLQEHVDHPSGRHVNLIPYIAANLEVFDLARRYKFNPAIQYTITKIGLTQRNLFRDAANYKHQYCHPDRALSPPPNFAAEEKFPRRNVAHNQEARKRGAIDSYEELLGTKLMVTRGNKVEGATAWIEACISSDPTTKRLDLAALIAYTNQGIQFANQLLKEHGVICKPAKEINQDDVDIPEPSCWSRCFR